MAEKLFHVGVKGLVRNSDGKFLLLHVRPGKLRPGDKDYWDIPGGRIQGTDNAETTLRREIEEETGITDVESIEFYTAAIANFDLPVESNKTVGLVLMIFTVAAVDDTRAQLNDEHDDYEWVTAEVASKRLEHKYPSEFTTKIAELK